MNLPGPMEIVVVLLVALIVLGPERLGTTARQAGRYYKQFREVTSGVQTEMRDLFDEATAEPDKPKSAELPADGTTDSTNTPDSTVDTDATVAGAAPTAPNPETVVVETGAPSAAADTASESSTPVVDADVVRE